MPWFSSTNVTLTNGSAVVTINDAADNVIVQDGDALLVPGFDPVEIKSKTSNTFVLEEVWAGATQLNVACKVMPTAGDLVAATAALRDAVNITQGNFQVLDDWGTQMGTVTFTGYDGVQYVAKTLQQMEADAPV